MTNKTLSLEIEEVLPVVIHCKIHNHEWVVGFNKCLIGMEKREACEE